MTQIINYIYIFLISMVPLIELRGAVPVGTALGLPWLPNLIVSIIGNCLPIPFILLFVKKVLTWMRGEPILNKKQEVIIRGSKIKLFNKISNWLFEKAAKHRPAIEKYATWGLFVFVAIPLPGTGAWSGALVASVFDMDKKKASLSIFGGVVTAGLIMTFGSQLVKFIIELF